MWGCNIGGNWGGLFGSGGWFMGGGLLGLLWKVLLIALIVFLVVKLIQGLGVGIDARRNRADDRDDSLEIIKNRLARGEITTDEYQRMKDVLAR